MCPFLCMVKALRALFHPLPSIVTLCHSDLLTCGELWPGPVLLEGSGLAKWSEVFTEPSAESAGKGLLTQVNWPMDPSSH